MGMETLKTKKQIGKILHPALLIMVLGVVYAFTVGGQPRGGPTDQDLLLEHQHQSTRSLDATMEQAAPSAAETDRTEQRAAYSEQHQVDASQSTSSEQRDDAAVESDNVQAASDRSTKDTDNSSERVRSASAEARSSAETRQEAATEQKKPQVVTHTVRLG